jgi:hypothetical protein
MQVQEETWSETETEGWDKEVGNRIVTQVVKRMWEIYYGGNQSVSSLSQKVWIKQETRKSSGLWKVPLSK